MNKVVLIGRLTKDPEIRYTQTGVTSAFLTLAVDRDFKDKDGNKQTDFINLTAWRTTAELLGKYAKKGNQLAIAGRIQVRNYEREGVKHYVTEVVAENIQFLGGKKPEEKAEDSEVLFDENDPLGVLTDEDMPF